MPIPYTKPFLTIPQQIALLSQRGLVITNTNFATECLANIGYYRLSGYWYPLRQVRRVAGAGGVVKEKVEDNFKPGSTFDEVVNIYSFDRELRLIVLDILERIEVSFRTDLVIQLGQYGPWSYRDPANFDPMFDNVIFPGRRKTLFKEFLDDFDNKTVPRSKAEFVTHFKNNYLGSLPIWVASELWDFGTLGVIFKGMKEVDKIAIASKYGLSKADVIASWIQSFSHTRNICAHHSRLWNKPPVKQPKLPSIVDVPDLSHLHTDRFASQRLYASLAVARYLQKRINPTSSWSIRLSDHVRNFPASQSLNFLSMGYPQSWETLPLWN